MPNRTSQVREGHAATARLIGEMGRELRGGRLQAGMTQREVAARIGSDQAHVSRVETGRIGRLGLGELIRHAGAVGLRPWVRLYPTVSRPMDAAQLALLGRLRPRSAPWAMRLEVAMPLRGDLRAADAVLERDGCRIVVEAITRLADIQAQLRAARLKQRDLAATRIILLVAATHANRRVVRSESALLAAAGLVGTRVTLAALGAGADPGADALVLL